MLRVGLTGSIAVGKSFVSSALAELGCHVLDADKTAREVVVPGGEGLRRVVEAFGREVLDADGALDRAKLGRIVFGDEPRRRLLNSILHPLIIAAQDEWLTARERDDPEGIAIIDAALMIETGSFRRFDKLIVVYCRDDIQLERLVRRDGLSFEDAGRRVAVQMPQAEKMRHADFLIDTSGTRQETWERVADVYERLRELASRRAVGENL